MDIQTAGLANLFSPVATARCAYRTNEDAYYAAHDGWVIPAWLSRLVAALHAPRRRPVEQPASIFVTRVA